MRTYQILRTDSVGAALFATLVFRFAWLWIPLALALLLIDTLRGPAPQAPRIGGRAGHEACNAAFSARHEAAFALRRPFLRNPCGSLNEWLGR